MESTAKNGDEGYSTWPGGAGGNEEDGRSRSGSNINSKETKWNIQTESERYINSLERKLSKISRADGPKAPRSREQSPLAVLSSTIPCDLTDTDSEHDGEVDDIPEEEMVDDNETACLLYDAARSNKKSSQKSRESQRDNLGSAGEVSASLVPKITFSNTVRISGGIKSSKEEIRHAFRIGSNDNYSRSLAQYNNASPLTSTHTPDAPDLLSTLASEHMSLSHSRAASFRSEISRASTPASLYAPLLLPSKTAPSPSRIFYLTFNRPGGESTYRELVQRQETARERKQKGKKEQKKNDLGGTDRWCFCLPTKSLDRAEEDLVEDQYDDNHSYGRAKSKSEMHVLFGGAPWRWLKPHYWAYRFRHLNGHDTGLEADEQI